MNQIMEWSQGNPGALMFLVDAAQSRNAISIMMKLEEAKTIRGTNLYVLFSDLCNKDLEKVDHLLRVCPVDVLEDACSRQDYSGRELVKHYLN